MVRRIALSGAILGMAFLMVGMLPVHAGGKKSDSKVKVSATVTKPDAAGKQLVTVILAHDLGWHTYANPVGNDDFDSNKTVVTVKAKGKPVNVKVDYPTGKVHKDKI